MSRGTSTIPPPPPKKPLTMPAAPPAMAAGIQGFQCFKAIALLRHSLPGEGVVYTWVKSRITVPARRNPATGGTQGALAGMERRPGGGASLCSASAGSSGEKTTLWWRIPRFFSSFRMTRARGHPSVFGDVSDPELRGVQFIPGSHGGENGNTPGQGGLDQIQLTGDQIDGVYDVIIGDCKKPFPVRRFVLFRNTGAVRTGGGCPAGARPWLLFSPIPR